MNLHAAIDFRFDHRVLFTRGEFEDGNGVLEGVLAGEGDLPRDEESGERQAGRLSHRGVVFVDDGVARAHPGFETKARAKLGGLLGVDVPVRVVPGGERVKNDPAHLDDILRTIHDAHLCRRSYVFAIGGGAVLDAVGYAAAVAHRGIRLVRFPTTTLSQDDSGVGVKNGVNAFGKKNFLGVFAPPYAVINDADFLETLGDRDWRAGFSEAVKVALVKDEALFESIERVAEAICRRDVDAALPVIARSAELHFDHITAGGDPFELTVARPLDFGHWSAHKLEQLSGYGLRHGEAVAVGVALDTVYSALGGFLPADRADRVLGCLGSLGLAIDHDLLDHPALLDGLEEFREHLGGRLTISLLRGIGDAFDAHEIDADLVRESIGFLRAHGKA